uniref:Uncharacterized protein n=1 Tax=Globodera rostochiensis TaxID=31243 RepID=A0A914IAR1_GLORO
MDGSNQQLTTYRYNRDEMLEIRESTFCRTRPDFLSKEFDNDDGLFSPDKWLQHQWVCEGVENRVRRKAASQTSGGSGGGGGSVSESDKQQATNKVRLRRGTSSASNGIDFKPDFQKSALEATNRPNRDGPVYNALNSGWSTATTSKQAGGEKSRNRRAGGDRTRKTTERRRSSNTGEEPLPEWMDEGPQSALDIIELMGFEEDIQKERESAKTEEASSPDNETTPPPLPMAMTTSRLKQWMGEGATSEAKGIVNGTQKTTLEASSRCASNNNNNASSSGGGSSAIGPPKQIQQHVPFYEPGLEGMGLPPMPGPVGFFHQQPMGPPYLPPSRSPQAQFPPPPPPPLVNNPNVTASRSFLTSPVFLPNSGNHPQHGVHPLQMRHPFFAPSGPGGMGMPPMPGPGLFHHHHHHVQQQQPPGIPAHLPPSRSPQAQFPPSPLVNNSNPISASRSFINSPVFMPNPGNHAQQGVHPLQMRHPFFPSNGPGGMGMPPMPGPGLFHHHNHVLQQQPPLIPAHLPPSRSPQAQFPPPLPPLVNSNNQISASRSSHFNQNYNLLNSPAFMPTSVMRQMSKVPGAGTSSAGGSETGSSTPNPIFPTGRSNIPPVLEKIFASVRGQPTPDRSMLVRAILGQGHSPDDPSFSCSR